MRPIASRDAHSGGGACSATSTIGSAQSYRYSSTGSVAAGTLIALGATELIMSEGAELRPLEVKGSRLDQAGAKVPSLTSNQALDILEQRFKSLFTEYFSQVRRDSDIGLSTRSAVEMASAVAPGLMAAVYGKLDPVKLAEADNAMGAVGAYAERLAKFNVKAGALTRLLTGYPSSHFIIDRSEAEELFTSVTGPKPALKALAECLRESSQLNAEHKAVSFFLTGFDKLSDDQIPIQPLAPAVPAATNNPDQTVDRKEHIRGAERVATEPKRLVAASQLVKRGPSQDTVTAVWHTGIYA